MTTRKQEIFKARLDDLSDLLDKVESHIPTLNDASAKTVESFCTDQISKIRDKINDADEKLKALQEDPAEAAGIKKALKTLKTLKKKAKKLEDRLISITKALPKDKKLDHSTARGEYFTEKFLKHHVRNHADAENKALEVWNLRVSLAKNFAELEKWIGKAIHTAEAIEVDPVPKSLTELKKLEFAQLSQPDAIESEQKIKENKALIKEASEQLEKLKSDLNNLIEEAPDKLKVSTFAQFKKFLGKIEQSKSAQGHTENAAFESTVIALSKQEIIAIAADLKRKLKDKTVDPNKDYKTKVKYAHWTIGGETMNARKKPKAQMKPLKCGLKDGKINHYAS